MSYDYPPVVLPRVFYYDENQGWVEKLQNNDNNNIVVRILYYDKNGKIIKNILIFNSKYSIKHYFYDKQGNETKVEKYSSDQKSKDIAKRKNYYDVANRIKKQICYDFLSNIENIYHFYYDTLGYSMVMDRMGGENFSDIAQTDYYQNDLLVKSKQYFGFEKTFEYEYDSLGKFIYEDLPFGIPPIRRYYTYTGELLNKTVDVYIEDNIIRDTSIITTYHYLFDSLQRPIQTIATTISDRDTIEKKVTITEYR